MTNEQIDTIAIAIFNASDGYKLGWSRLTDNAKNTYRYQAREAINAYEGIMK